MTQLTKYYDQTKSEKHWRDFWFKNQIYEFEEGSKKPIYSIDTPPPYISAEHLHAGHLMSYTQAEFIARYKRMRGYNVYYPMGFDDNGFPTERFVEKKYKIDKSKVSQTEFIKLCLNETQQGIKNYRDCWEALGISVDWKKGYSTINPLATKISQWSLLALYKKGYLYRREAPTLWCSHCQTALAQADLEDKEQASVMNYIKFELTDKTKLSNGEKSLVIMTTRPELLPACVALYFNPNDERYINLKGHAARVPIFNYKVPIKTSGQVDKNLGTGIMMVCTWGDKEDVDKWQQDKLETRTIIEKDGCLNKLALNYSGLKLETARRQVIDDLRERGLLLKQEKLKHTLNVHERCETPIEFVQTKQWFIKLIDMQEKWLDLGKKINWYPAKMYKIYETWVKALKWDWCISRQRYYGVPFPIWYCQNCDEPVFAEEKNLPVNPMEAKPSIEKCPKCGSFDFKPEEGVMDTWATSTCSPFLIKELVKDKKDKAKLFPVSLRPNAHEIIRTWDFYSIVKSYYHFGKIPFENIMISGHGLAENGVAFAKRLGNYIPSNELVKKYGGDPLRFWATGAGLGENLRFSSKEIERGKRTMNKLWNSARFLMMHLTSTAPSISLPVEEGAGGGKKFDYADIWIVEEMNKTIVESTKAFESYNYSNVKKAIEDFFWNKYSDYYIEFIKYRLYQGEKEDKLAALYTMSQVFLTILKIYAPLIPFITEELYQNLIKFKFISQLITNMERSVPKSIHVSVWPKTLLLRYNLDMSGFNNVLKAIEEIRKYKSEQGISQGKELENFQIRTQFDHERFGSFVEQVCKVKKINNPE